MAVSKVYLDCITCFADAFDKEYRRAYKRLFESKNYSDLLCPEDRNPPARAVYCRRTFDTPTLQPRLPKYLVSSFTWGTWGTHLYLVLRDSLLRIEGWGRSCASWEVVGGLWGFLIPQKKWNGWSRIRCLESVRALSLVILCKMAGLNWQWGMWWIVTSRLTFPS